MCQTSMDLATLLLVIATAQITLAGKSIAVSAATGDIIEQSKTILDEETRIVGGNLAVLGQFPWHVALTISGHPQSVFCGGALIRSNWVLTTAWCVQGFDEMDLVFGAVRLSQVITNVIVPVTSEDFYVHPDYQNTARTHDVALINVKEQFLPSPTIAPVTLISNQQYVGILAQLSGFGVTEDEVNSPQLLWVDIPVITNSLCRSLMQPVSVFPITSNHLCTSVIGRGACTNDRGGPLVVKVEGQPMLIGLVTYLVEQNCSSGFPTIYTSVATHGTWIKAVAGASSVVVANASVLLLALILVERCFY